MDKWIYGFKRVGSRELGELDRADLRRLARRAAMLGLRRAAVALVFVLGIFVGVAFAAGGYVFGWLLVLASAFASIWWMFRANDHDTVRLLCRRALRLGRLSRFEFVGATDAVRRAYARGDPDEGRGGRTDFWSNEERMIEKLEKLLGHQATWIETLDEDSVLITAEGKVVNFDMEAWIVDVDD